MFAFAFIIIFNFSPPTPVIHEKKKISSPHPSTYSNRRASKPQIIKPRLSKPSSSSSSSSSSSLSYQQTSVRQGIFTHHHDDNSYKIPKLSQPLKHVRVVTPAGLHSQTSGGGDQNNVPRTRWDHPTPAAVDSGVRNTVSQTRFDVPPPNISLDNKTR